MNHDTNASPERIELAPGYTLEKYDVEQTNGVFSEWCVKFNGRHIAPYEENFRDLAAAMQPEPITYMADIALDLTEEELKPGAILVKKAATVHTTAEADLAKAREVIAELETDARGLWCALFMDGRNEHGTHVIPLPQSTLVQPVLEEDLENDAETIFQAAEANGYKTGHAIVCMFRFVREEYHHGYYEFEKFSPSMTRLIFGTPEKQDEEIAKHYQEPDAALQSARAFIGEGK